MIKRLSALLLMLISLATFQVAMAAEKFDVPADALALLPADPAAVVAVTSVDAMVDQYNAIMAAIDEDAISRADLIEGIESELPRFSEFVAMDRPLVFVSGIPNLMGGGEPPLTFIVPLNPDFKDREAMLTEAGFAAHAVIGDYLAVSTVPTYAPATTPPDLAAHLAQGVITATLDLEMVVLNFRPFIEMGLAGIPTQSDANPDGMTAEEVESLATTLRNVLDSVTRLDLSLGRDDNLITWHTGLGVVPGSALDAGPQPDFSRALDLTKALPTDADFLQVIALDQTLIFEAFRDYYLITMKGALSGMAEDQAARYGAWVENYLSSMDLWASPMAAALRMDDDGMAGHVIMEPDDADAGVEKLSEILNGMSELGIGYTLTQRENEKIGGVKFRAWDVDFDLEQFETVMPQGISPAMSGTDRMQAEQMVSILRKIMPVIYLGAKDGKLFIASDADTDALERMVKAAGKRGKPAASVAAIADKTGPACQQVITGDMLAIINWVTELMEEIDDEQRTLMEGNPIPFEATFTINNPDFGFNMGMDLEAMGNLIKAAKELDAMGHDDVGEETAE